MAVVSENRHWCRSEVDATRANRSDEGQCLILHCGVVQLCSAQLPAEVGERVLHFI